LIYKKTQASAGLGQIISGGSPTIPGRAADSDNDFIFHQRVPPLKFSESMIDRGMF
jgi:hypothetical protein